MALSEWNPDTGHPIGCTCRDCEEYWSRKADQMKRILQKRIS